MHVYSMFGTHRNERPRKIQQTDDRHRLHHGVVAYGDLAVAL